MIRFQHRCVYTCILIGSLIIMASCMPTLRRSSKETKEIVKSLMQTLTLKGKIGQMTQLNIDQILVDGSGYEIDPVKMQTAVNYGVGSFLNSMYSTGPINGLPGLNVTQWIDLITNIQTYVMNNTPQNISSSPIPMVYGLDSVHGAVYVYGSTYFPHNLGIAATFDPNCAFQATSIAAKDTRTAGVPWAFSPVLGVGIQPLWPRLYETFGEDPTVASVMGTAAVSGFQGKDLSSVTSVAACMKHFLGYPAPKSGKDRTPAWIPNRMLRRYFVPPFQAAVNAGVATVMVNSAEINGVPVHASHEYLTDLLRTELGFEGFAVTDWQDIEKLNFYHHVAATSEEAVQMAIDAGIDMSMVPDDYTFSDILYQLVESGTIAESSIDKSVERILTVKVNLGLLDNPYPDKTSPFIETVGSEQDRNVSLSIARESITLLKNDGNVLPLSPDIGSILVTGPCGNSLTNQNGGWSIHWQGAQSESEFPFGTTIYQGIQQIVSQKTQVQYIQGVDFDSVTSLTQAVTAAKQADVVILCVGEGPEAEVVGDINDLTISDPQIQLMNAIYQTGTPVVLVLIEARPRILPPVVQTIPAILMGYLPSSEGGQAIAEILFGQVNPSGKLPLTYPQFSGDVGVPYYHKYSEEGVTFPLFEFGFGLSYTTFTYSDLQLSENSIPIGESVAVSITVTNTGNMAGKEAVLLYLSDLYASVTPEVKMLKYFQKDYFNPGDSKQFTFTLQPEDFSFIGINDKPVIEAGDFIITVGNLTATLTLTGSTTSALKMQQNIILN